MTSNNIYNNNAKFQKLKTSSCFSPYCHKKQNHKISYFSESRFINNGMNTDKNFYPNKNKYNTNLNISTDPNINSTNMTKVNLQHQQNQEFFRKSANYLSDVCNKNQKIIDKNKKETQSYKKSNSKIRIIKSGVPSFPSNIENTNSNILYSSAARLNSNVNLHSTKSSGNMNILINRYNINNNNNSTYLYKNCSTRKLDVNNYDILSNITQNNIKKLNVSSSKAPNSNLLRSSNSELFSSCIQNKTHTNSFFNYGNIGINSSNNINNVSNINSHNNQIGYLFTSGNSNYNHPLSPHLSRGNSKEYYNNISKRQQVNPNRNNNTGNTSNEIFLVNNSTDYLPTSPNNNRAMYKSYNNGIFRNISNNMVSKGYPTILLKNKSIVTKDNTTATNQSDNDSKQKKDSILTEQTLYNKNENEKSIEDIHFMFVKMIQNGRKLELKLEQDVNNKLY